MADVYTVPELTWAAGNLSVANLNQYVRDNMQALRAGLTDSSADADIVQAIKSGTLSARSGVAHSNGRMYRATDIKSSFISDTAVWEHAGGSGVFDSFGRANLGSEPSIGTADSGHVWSEPLGDIDIITSDHVEGVTGAPAIATVDTGAPLRTAHYGMTFNVGNSAANVAAGLVLRYVDNNNYLYVQAIGASNRVEITKFVGGVSTPVSNAGYTFVALTIYNLDVFVRGPSVLVQLALQSTGSPTRFLHSVSTDTYSVGGFATATQAGVRFGTVGAGTQSVYDFFCIPNA